MNMMVSGISKKDGHKVAYVMFEEGKRFAEAEIPKCKIIENHGFSEAEVVQLEIYMKANLQALKKQAAGVNPIRAMLKGGKENKGGDRT